MPHAFISRMLFWAPSVALQEFPQGADKFNKGSFDLPPQKSPTVGVAISRIKLSPRGMILYIAQIFFCKCNPNPCINV